MLVRGGSESGLAFIEPPAIREVITPSDCLRLGREKKFTTLHVEVYDICVFFGPITMLMDDTGTYIRALYFLFSDMFSVQGYYVDRAAGTHI